MNVYAGWFNVLRVGSDFRTMHYFPGNGGDTFDINFAGGYISTAHVKALDEQDSPLGVTFLTPARVKLSRKIPVGSAVLIYRDTPKDLPIMAFKDGVNLTARALDTNAKQAVFVAAEMLDRFDTFGSSLETSVAQVSEALRVAQEAVAIAHNAEDIAEEAVRIAQAAGTSVRSHTTLADRSEPDAHPASAINWAEFNTTPEALAKVTTGLGEVVSLGAERNLRKYITEAIRVTDFPYLVQGNGTDESVKVQQCLTDAGLRGGGAIEIPPHMVIRCDNPLVGFSGVSMKSDGTSYLDFSHRTSYLTQQDMGLMVYRGAPIYEELLTTDAVKGTNKIKVSDYTLFPVGTLVCISMDDKGQWDDPSIRVTAGQMARVTGTYPGTNNITLDNPIWETLSVSKGALIRKIRPVTNITIDGVGFIGKGRPAIGPGDQGLKFFMGTNVHVRNCNFVGVDARSVDFIQCYGWSADNNVLEFDPLGELNEISYGIAYSCSMFGSITRNRLHNMRHGIVSSHLSRALVNKYFGVSRFVDIRGNFVTGNYGDLGTSGWVRAHAGISTHTDAEYINIEQNTVTGCRYGVNPRTQNIRVANNTIAGNPIGVSLSESYRSLWILHNDISDCYQWISSPVEPGDFVRDNLHVIGNRITGCTTGNIATGAQSPGLRVLDNIVDGVPFSQGGALRIAGPFSGLVDRNSFNNLQALGVRAEGVGKLLLSNNLFENQPAELACIFTSPLLSPEAYQKNNTSINAGSFSGDLNRMSGSLIL